MNFPQTAKYLLSLGNEVSAMKLGLENIRTLLVALDDPQNKFLKVQVAGTNGKGSVCAFLDAICASAGIKTGLYTSPHLVSMTERVRINGSEISEEDFARCATRVRETAENLLTKGKLEYLPTFFEQITAIALTAFAKAKVKLAILETGLGGRLDATTAANAEIAAITRIDYDHQEYLGETIDLIAAEKAAIIRQDSKVVVAEQNPGAMSVIMSVCDKADIFPMLAERVRADDDNGQLRFETENAVYTINKLSLLGRHQIENAKVAILLAETLRGNFNISNEHIIEGLQNAKHNGRLEFAENILFDGAHNVAGARALREYLNEFVDQPITLIFGSMKDKDVAEIAHILFPAADKLILTKPDNLRAMSAEQLAKFVPEDLDPEKIYLTESVKDALKTARKISPQGNLVCITGSLYLVGEVKKILNN